MKTSTEMMNSSTMGLYFIKEIDGFKEEGEAHKARQYQDNCQHNYIFLQEAKTGARVGHARTSGCISGN